jgi:hypothetical protein
VLTTLNPFFDITKFLKQKGKKKGAKAPFAAFNQRVIYWLFVFL